MLDILGLGVDIACYAGTLKVSTTKEIDMKNADMPAMPIFNENGAPAHWSSGGLENDGVMCGLTKREMMAMHFHAAMLSAHNEGEWSGVGCGAAEWAVKEADALLAELEKQQ